MDSGPLCLLKRGAGTRRFWAEEIDGINQPSGELQPLTHVALSGCCSRSESGPNGAWLRGTGPWGGGGTSTPRFRYQNVRSEPPRNHERQRANNKAKGLLKEGSLGSESGEAVELRPVPTWVVLCQVFEGKTTLWGNSLVIGYSGTAVLSSVSHWVFLRHGSLVPGTVVSLTDHLGAVPPWPVCSDILSCWLGCLHARSDQTVNNIFLFASQKGK